MRQAIDIMLGDSLPLEKRPGLSYCFVKRAVFSDHVFTHRDLGPEMLSTGEVMGWGHNRAEALCKAKASSDVSAQPSVLSLQDLLP